MQNYINKLKWKTKPLLKNNNFWKIKLWNWYKMQNKNINSFNLYFIKLAKIRIPFSE